jgi:hypothetical protein
VYGDVKISSVKHVLAVASRRLMAADKEQGTSTFAGMLDSVAFASPSKHKSRNVALSEEVKQAAEVKEIERE